MLVVPSIESSTRVRSATSADAAACAEIYAPYVTDTAISFETLPPGAEEMAERIAAAHAWLVLEDAGRVVATRTADRSIAVPPTAGRVR